MMSKNHPARPAVVPRWPMVLVFLIGAAAGGNALAYKVERICEMSEPTGKKPATKTCKTVLVRPEGAAKDEKKEAKKEEKPAAGHH